MGRGDARILSGVSDVNGPHLLHADEIELSEEERDALQKKMAAMDALFKEMGRAKYKIELFWGSKFSVRQPSAGALSFWESGAAFHGGGDTKIYICPGRKRGVSDCAHMIPDAFNEQGKLVCPNCGQVWKGEEVIGEVFGRWTMRQWASKLFEYFKQLEMNADILVKYPPEDIRSASLQEVESARYGGEKLAKARGKRSRATHIYPLRNIIKDTSNGADLLGRFYAFLTA